MNKANYGAPYTHRLTLRLTDKQYEFVVDNAEAVGVTPSDYVRMFINSGLTVQERMNAEAKKEARKARKAQK